MPFGIYLKIIQVVTRGSALCGNLRGECRVDFGPQELVLRLLGFLISAPVLSLKTRKMKWPSNAVCYALGVTSI